MTFEEVKESTRKKEYLFSEHADEERTKDELTVKEVEQAILGGSVIEKRPEDARGESYLIAGESNNGRFIHIVMGVRFNRPVIVTVYLPSDTLWIHGKIRKR